MNVLKFPQPWVVNRIIKAMEKPFTSHKLFFEMDGLIDKGVAFTSLTCYLFKPVLFKHPKERSLLGINKPTLSLPVTKKVVAFHLNRILVVVYAFDLNWRQSIYFCCLSAKPLLLIFELQFSFFSLNENLFKLVHVGSELFDWSSVCFLLVVLLG